MELKGSKTEANLWKAFAGESMARNKYTYFAGKAKKEGFEQIAAIFEETAGNEKEHAKLWFKELGGLGDTAANLKSAAAGENEEWTQMYREMAETAKEEGFERLALLFEGVGKIREGARRALPGPPQEPGRGRCVPEGRRLCLEVPQLRPPACGQGSPRGLPRVRPSPGLF